jgi:hypothetical protein
MDFASCNYIKYNYSKAHLECEKPDINLKLFNAMTTDIFYSRILSQVQVYPKY